MDNTQGAKGATVRTIAIGIAAGAAVAVLTLCGHAFHGLSEWNGNRFNYYSGFRDINDNKVSGIWFNCDTSGDIVIPYEIDGVAVRAFSIYHNKSVTSVEAPDSITNIESINGCPMLESVDIPDGVTRIRGIVDCPLLESITIPSSVEYIGSIENCDALNEINISDGASSLHFIFTNCPSLNSIKLPSSVSTGDCYFDFKNCSSLTEIEIPDGVTRINGNPFDGCSNLRRISISASTEINEETARNYGWLDKVYRREN